MKLINLLLFVFFNLTLTAQSIQKKIINATGTTYQANGATLRVSVGEPIVGSFNNSVSTTLSQGFFTGFTNKTVVTDPPVASTGTTISIYPNPVKDMLSIQGAPANAKQWQFFDVAGHCLFTRDISVGKTINVQNLPSGFYIARLLNGAGELLHVFKIVKL